jgi:hypothetical protein
VTINNGYVELDDYKLAREIDDNKDDSTLESMIEAASRAIDLVTWRRFYSVTEKRYYTADESILLYTDDYTSITALKTDDSGDGVYNVTWQATDYNEAPYNADLDSKPYTSIETAANGDYGFPITIKKGVELEAAFGYATTTPPGIQEACILTVNRLKWRRDTPGGASGAVSMGQINMVVMRLRQDPDIMDLLGPFIRRA